MITCWGVVKVKFTRLVQLVLGYQGVSDWKPGNNVNPDHTLYPTVRTLLVRQVPSNGTRLYSTAQNEPKDNRQLWLLVIPVTTFFLGTWQIFRLQWKLGLIDELERKTMVSPIEMPSKYGIAAG